MMSTVVMGVLGFFFWIINARLFTPSQVGIATTLISVITLITSFSLLGFNNGIIRYIPKSTRKNELITSVFILVTLTSISIALIYLVLINVFSPKLLFVRENTFFALFFVVFAAISTINLILESIFIAHRSSKYVLLKNIVWSLLKLSLPLLLLTLGAYGIFISVGIASTLAVLLSIFILFLKFNYIFKPKIYKDVISRMTKFSFGNYVATFLGGLPLLALPILITNKLGPSLTAYYYMPVMIASFLFIIPQAITQSLFAEGSHNEEGFEEFYKKSLKLNALLFLPAMMIIYFLGKYILLVFGIDYAVEGTEFLQLLAISGTFIYINSVGAAILNIKYRIKKLVLINFLSASLILGLSYYLLPMELLGIGIAWLVGQGIISIIYLLNIKKFLK